MTFFLTYDIHFFSLALLGFILLTMRIKGDFVSASNRIFTALVVTNMYLLVLEIISWQFDGKPGAFNYYANYISNMLFAWSGPIISCLWVSYIDYHMYRSYDRIKKNYFFLYPMIILTLFIIINFFTPFIFSVSESNVYSREPFMWLIIVVNSFIIIYKWLDAYRNRTYINREIVIAMLLYITLPAIASAIQVIIYGAFVMWPTMAITIVLTYFYLDTVSTSKDYLTRLMSRQAIDNTIEYLMSKETPFTVVMIDLDKFKTINDTHGHVIGDEALIQFAAVLSSVFKKTAKIGRFAGDEFIVLVEHKNGSDIDTKMTELEEQLLIHNASKHSRYDLAFSYGSYEYTPTEDISQEQLIHLADEIMYERKHANR